MEESEDQKKYLARWGSFVFTLIQAGVLYWLYRIKLASPEDLNYNQALSVSVQFPLAIIFAILFALVGIWTALYGQGKQYFIAHLILAAFIFMIIIA